jgi:sugar phosphate permease
MSRLISKLVSGRMHYGWIAVGVTFLTLLVSAGIRSAPTVLLVPLEQEFGWDAATVSLPVSIGLLLYGLIGPFSAGFIDRIGLRAVMIAALGLMALGFGLTPLIGAAWQLLLLWGLLVGSGSGMAAMVLGAVVANRWFVARRGLVIGLLTGSAAAGQLVFIKLLDALSREMGWRVAVLTACALPLLMIPVVALFMRDRPGDVGLPPYGETALAAPPPAPANPFSVALAALGYGLVSRDFWLLSASFFVCGASTIGLVGTHFIAFCFDHGVAQQTAATLLVAMGVCNFVGTTA